MGHGWAVLLNPLEDTVGAPTVAQENASQLNLVTGPWIVSYVSSTPIQI